LDIDNQNKRKEYEKYTNKQFFFPDNHFVFIHFTLLSPFSLLNPMISMSSIGECPPQHLEGTRRHPNKLHLGFGIQHAGLDRHGMIVLYKRMRAPVLAALLHWFSKKTQ
jgi:hypothetical protein